MGLGASFLGGDGVRGLEGVVGCYQPDLDNKNAENNSLDFTGKSGKSTLWTNAGQD